MGGLFGVVSPCSSACCVVHVGFVVGIGGKNNIDAY